MDYKVAHDKDNKEFIVDVDGNISVLVYSIDGSRMLFHSVNVPPVLKGRGIASILTKEALEYAVENKLSIVPICSFVSAYVLRNPEYKEYLDNN